MLGVFGAFSVIAKLLTNSNPHELSAKSGRVFLPLIPKTNNVYNDQPEAVNSIYCCVVGLLFCVIIAVTINFNLYGPPKQPKSTQLPY